MTKYSLQDIEIETSRDGADTVIRGSAEVRTPSSSRVVTAGGRLTAEEVRGGKKLEAELEDVAVKLVRLAFKVASREAEGG